MDPFSVMLVLLVALAFYSLYSWLRKSFWVVFPLTAVNIFRESSQRPRGPIETDQAKRDAVLKQGFRQADVPDNLDAIVIGSGVGGLGVAAILAKAGKKVLVLEQHDRAGGNCHTFIEKGYEFDTGLHYIGEMQKGSLLRLLMDEMTEGQVDWAPLNNTYDVVALGHPESAKLVPIRKGRREQMEEIIKHFPNERAGIEKFYGQLRGQGFSLGMGVLKLFPLRFSLFLIKLGWFLKIFPVFKKVKLTLQQYLDELTDNADLKAVLSYAFGDYGALPKDAPLMMHNLLVDHFARNGGFYPIGGSSEIPLHIIPTIERAGGRVLVRATVSRILLDQSNKMATGVVVKKGEQEYTIKAPLVISNAGINNTGRMLPLRAMGAKEMKSSVKRLGLSLSCVNLFIGLRAKAEELDIPMAQNIWLWKKSNFESLDKIYDEDAEESERFNLQFISFPSTKDPEWEQRYPGRTTCLVISLGTHQLFEEWFNSKTGHRGKDYEGLKQDFGRALFGDLCKMYPQLEDKVEYLDVGTPLTYQHYLGGMEGEIYGLNHSAKRFDPEMLAVLRPETSIKGLYITGQDISTCGIVGGLLGGVLCGSAILKRNLMGDLVNLKRKQKKIKND